MHDPAPGPEWSESWTFDFAATDASLGGWARLTLFPGRHIAWYQAYLAGPDRQLVAVVDTEVPVPRGTLELRTHGLWADHICETPFDHWTLGLEAFGLGLDDPRELYGRALGDRVPLGYDLEWETEGSRIDTGGPSVRYEVPCRVSGEVLVAATVIDFTGVGHRDHAWGPPRAGGEWVRAWGRFDDGSRFRMASGEDGVRVESSLDADGSPTGARLWVGEAEIAVDPLAVTPVVGDDGGRAPRALCRYTATDGRSGAGWAEWNQPGV